MGDDIAQMEVLRARIRELEDKVEALRISRRVLMNLIDSIEKEKRERLMHLENINDRLQKNNCRYARAIMCRNVKILQLEEKLRLITVKSTLGNGPT
jgi:tRNA isopentenyl-2-thiomethyl-A-37 hydroxylase MiaE